MIPTTIKTNERIFKEHTHDKDIFLCNKDTLHKLNSNDIDKIYHFWDFKFVRISKKDALSIC